jgi:hypothetical protein
MMGFFKLSVSNMKEPISVDPDIFLPNQGHIGPADQDRLLSELRTIAMGIVARDGSLKLRKSDVVKLYGTLRRVLRDMARS